LKPPNNDEPLSKFACFGFNFNLRPCSKAVRLGGAGAAAAEGLMELAKDMAAAVFTVPLRGLFRTIQSISR